MPGLCARVLLIGLVAAAAGGHLQAAVVCIGETGHVELERVLDGCCLQDAGEHLAADGLRDLAGCGACRDVATGDMQTQRRADDLPLPAVAVLEPVDVDRDARAPRPAPIDALCAGPPVRSGTVLRL